jgi:hypothetical protein
MLASSVKWLINARGGMTTTSARRAAAAPSEPHCTISGVVWHPRFGRKGVDDGHNRRSQFLTSNGRSSGEARS